MPDSEKPGRFRVICLKNELLVKERDLLTVLEASVE